MLKRGSVVVLATALTLTIGLSEPIKTFAATVVNLGTSENFAVLGGSQVTNVPTSIITGDVGLSPAAGSFYNGGVTSAQVSGAIYAADATGPAGSVVNPSLLTIAKNDLTAAYIDAAGRTPTTTFVAGDNQLGGQTLTPGVYAFGGATSANLTAASPLVLDAQNDPNAVFIFQASSDLVTASGSTVSLINGAQACNVYWKVTSSATLGTNSNFKGNILALTSATLLTGANVEGRVLARNGAVTLDSNTIIRSVCGASTTSTGTTVPGLPNAGFAPKSVSIAWLALALAGLIAMIISAVAVRKNKIA